VANGWTRESGARDLAGGRSAVDGERRAGHESRLVTQQECHESRHFIGCGDSSRGIGCGEIGPVDVRSSAEQLAVEGGVDVAGHQGIDADAVGGIGECGGAREADDTMLGRDVSGQLADSAGSSA
jgi:hypothetical protein